MDQLVIGIAKLPRKLGKDLLAGYQNGLIQFYAAVSALGVAVLLFIVMLLNPSRIFWAASCFCSERPPRKQRR